MCGIVGYVGKQEATPVLLEGLRRLEYRGYGSAGLAILADGELQVRKRVGRVASLAQLLEEEPVTGSMGISHTRWATRGLPSDANAHLHLDQSARLALVHNGIIENYASLRQRTALPEPPHGEGHAGGRYFSIGRDRRHPGGDSWRVC